MRESMSLEFKATFVSDLNKEVIAFANTNGGEIYVGLNDNGTACGLKNINDVELQCINHIANTIKPDITPFVKYEKTVVDGKDVLKIVVNKGSMTPYYIAGKGIRPEGVYLRMGTASVPASETAIVKMIKETTGDAYEDTRSLNQNLTFIQAEQEFSSADVSFGDTKKKSLGLIGRDGCYTNLGLLLSDQCEHKIKFAVYEGVQKQVFKDRHEFSGSLFRQFEDLTRMLDSYNRLSSPKLSGMKRTDKRDYPVEAIRESLLNAMVHRDYGLGGYTLISVFDDRIEIISLGGLMRGVEMSDIMMGVSYLRNKKLAEVFYRLHLIEAYGTGIEKIKDCYRGQLKQPVFECSPNAFKVVLPKLGTYASVVNGRDDEIIAMLKEKGEIVRGDVEKRLNVSQATATRILTHMVESGKIKRSGSARSIKYTL